MKQRQENFPDYKDHIKEWVIDGQDIGKAFQEYQNTMAKEASAREFQVEKDTHAILSLSNIILIKNGQHDRTFGSHLSQDMMKSIEEVIVVDSLSKIQRHAAFLSGRHLSIRGASLVANSLLLSRIWHPLRVVPVPASWLASIRRLVSKFVLPFASAPSCWQTVCRPKALGGLGLIDLDDQHLALQMVYIQRIIRPASEARQRMDFTTPFILDLLMHHTGLNNVLPLFLFPRQYAANALSIRIGHMPMLHHLPHFCCCPYCKYVALNNSLCCSLRKYYK